MHCEDNPEHEENPGVTPRDVGGDFEIAPDAGGVTDPPLDDEDEDESDRVTPEPENLTTPEPTVEP